MFEIKNPKVNVDYGFNDKEPKESHLQLFKDLADLSDNTKPMEKALLVLCTPRCGSTLFSEALNSCGRLGICEEWFNYDYFNAYTKLFGCTFNLTSYLEFVQRKSLRDTGVFCLKLHIGQLIQMNKDYALGVESMDFDHIVYLNRRDKIAQAVSLCKATSSDQFRSYEKAVSEARTTRHAIASALENIIKFDCFARKYLWKYVNSAYDYEDFQQLTTPQTRADTSYTKVLQALGRDNTVGPRARKSWEYYCFTVDRLKKQGDRSSVIAADDFRDYLRGDVK
jgi:LPS sulfotransferase NodH